MRHAGRFAPSPSANLHIGNLRTAVLAWLFARSTGRRFLLRVDDLLPSSPRQAYLADVLGYPRPTYAHVPLVLNATGARLAKRDGAVTLSQIGVARAVADMSASLGWPSRSLDELLTQFDPARLPREPWVYAS